MIKTLGNYSICNLESLNLHVKGKIILNKSSEAKFGGFFIAPDIKELFAGLGHSVGCSSD